MFGHTGGTCKKNFFKKNEIFTIVTDNEYKINFQRTYYRPLLNPSTAPTHLTQRDKEETLLHVHLPTLNYINLNWIRPTSSFFTQ